MEIVENHNRQMKNNKAQQVVEKTVRHHELSASGHGVEVGAGGEDHRISEVIRRQMIESAANFAAPPHN